MSPRGKTYKKKETVTKAVVARMIDSKKELKETTNSLSATFGTITSANWVEIEMLNPPQGDNYASRDGREVQIHSLHVYGVYTTGTAETAFDDPYNVLRVVLGIWRGAGGATPLTTAGAGMSDNLTTFGNTRNLLQKKLYDKYHTLQVTSTEKGGGDGYTPQVKVLKIYKKFKRPLTMKWGTDGTDYPNIRLILSMKSDSAAAPSPGFIAGYYSCRWSDN